MMVEQAKMSDEMYENSGVEEEDFMAALLHHNLMHDPEIMKLQIDNMKKLGLGGGMGGFGGMGM